MFYDGGDMFRGKLCGDASTLAVRGREGGSHGEREHEERGADAREAAGGVDGVTAGGRGRH